MHLFNLIIIRKNFNFATGELFFPLATEHAILFVRQWISLFCSNSNQYSRLKKQTASLLTAQIFLLFAIDKVESVDKFGAWIVYFILLTL